MNQLLEEVVHQSYCSFYFLILTCLLCDESSLSSWHIHVLLSFEVGFLRIGNEHLSHVIYDHADPLSVHDLEATDSFKAFVTLLKGLENLIGIAGAFPAALLI